MSEAPKLVARLVWHKADGTTAEFPLTSETNRVGRDPDADVFLDEPLVSRAHAEIVRSGDEFLVRDLGATNLTRVNDCIITRCALHNGDELRFARARCVFVCASTAAGSPARDTEKPA
jgi:pSer/pThr/pTyr-binding forkhead associated (FHA) protein